MNIKIIAFNSLSANAILTENGEDLLTDTETYHDRNLMKASVDTSGIPSLSNQQIEVLLLSPYIQN